jgi:hypothetical protein
MGSPKSIPERRRCYNNFVYNGSIIFLFDPRVKGSSMAPTIHDDHILWTLRKWNALGAP